jgi:hypothetical protein
MIVHLLYRDKLLYHDCICEDSIGQSQFKPVSKGELVYILHSIFLIAYYSETGNTKQVAEAIYEKASRGHDVESVGGSKIK